MLDLRSPTEDDYQRVMAALATWWDLGGAPDAMAAERQNLLPRLFFQHFTDTSFILDEGEALAAFLTGFLSQSRPKEGYIHFVGVAPPLRKRGIAAALYTRFFELCRENGRSEVHCITSPGNTRSIEFHKRLGFVVTEAIVDYDGPGKDRVAFVRYL